MAQLGSTSEQGRLYNERIILHLVRQYPGISRVHIAAKTGLSAQTISVISSALLERGLLTVTGKVKGNRGQPSVMLSICPEGAFGLGINVDRDHISAALIDFSGKCILLREQAVQFPTQQQAQSIALSLINEVKQTLGDGWQQVQGVGLAKPDHMSLWLESLVTDTHQRQQLDELSAALTYWQTDQFSQWLSEQTELKILTANDANAAALNELLLSKSAHKKHFFYIYIGTACGGGVVTDGECYYGAYGRAADFGLIPTATGCFGKQILEAFSISSLAHYLDQAGKTYPQQAEDWLDAGVHLRLQDWMETVSDEVLPALIAVIALYDPECILFGGRLPKLVLEPLLAGLTQKLQQACPPGMQIPPLGVAETGATAGVVGAAILPLYDTFAPYRSLLLIDEKQ